MGIIDSIKSMLDPNEWFETEVIPELVINVEGNFDAVLNANENQIGTVWDSWSTQWTLIL